MQHLEAVYFDVEMSCENLATWDSPYFFIVGNRCHIHVLMSDIKSSVKLDTVLSPTPIKKFIPQG
jgi:hypothetical protein